MHTDDHVDVLVCGAGPVGLFAALALADRGLSVQIIDEYWRGGAHSYALALHSQTIKLLNRYGLATDLLAGSTAIEGMDLYDAHQRRAVARIPSPTDELPFLLVIRQDLFEQLLSMKLQDRGGRILWNHRLAALDEDAQGVTATVEVLGRRSGGYAIATTDWAIERTQRTHARFVIGADGHKSTVRRLLRVDFPETADPQSFAVFEFTHAGELPRTVQLVLGPSDVDVLWPMPEHRCRWSFELAGAQVATDSRRKSRLALQVGREFYPYLDPPYLHELLASRAPWFSAEVRQMNWSMAVRFERRLATRFGRGRCWLAGDAAHLTGPVGVQSMNVGLREAVDLADAIACRIGGPARSGVARGDGAGSAPDRMAGDALEIYNTQRLTEWRQLLSADALIPTDRTDPWLAQQAPRLLPCLPASGEDLARLAADLGFQLSSTAPQPARAQ